MTAINSLFTMAETAFNHGWIRSTMIQTLADHECYLAHKLQVFRCIKMYAAYAGYPQVTMCYFIQNKYASYQP